MDKEFIRKYCESVYPELEVTLFMMYEELLADYMDMEHEMAVSVYLLGAEDREKMLR